MAPKIGESKSPYGSRKTILKRRALLAGATAALATTAVAQVGNPDGSSIVVSGGKLTATGATTGGVVYDFPTNGSGLGIPAILRHTVNFLYVTGVTPGSGQTTGTRTATQTAMQNALNYYSTENVFYELPPAVLEIYGSSPLTIPWANPGLVWRGAGRQAQITQFYATSPGVPVLQFGDSTGANYIYNLDFSGANLQYGTSQTGFTNTAYIAVAGLAYSRINEVYGGSPAIPNPVNPGYYGAWIQSVGGGTNLFSCNFSKWNFSGAQHALYRIGNMGTGGVIDNWYMSGGAGSNLASPPAVAGNVWDCNLSSGSTEWDINQVNTEWVTATGAAPGNAALNFENWLGLNISHLHQEGLNFVNGGSSTVANLAWQVCPMTIKNWGVYEYNITSANMSSAAFYWLYDAYVPDSSTVIIDNIIFQAESIGSTPSTINIATTFFGEVGENYGASIMTANNFHLNDQYGNNFVGAMSMDNNMPVGSNQFLCPNTFSRYEFYPSGSRLTQAGLKVSAAYNHYGQLKDAILQLAATGTYNINLMATMGATGAQVPDPGTRVRIIRQNNTWTSGTVTIQNAGSNIATNTSATPQTFVFDGTNWALKAGVN